MTDKLIDCIVDFFETYNIYDFKTQLKLLKKARKQYMKLYNYTDDEDELIRIMTIVDALNSVINDLENITE